jgi:hypothetical protein
MGLLITGGSDFHELDGAYGSNLGCPELTGAMVEKIRRRAR